MPSRGGRAPAEEFILAHGDPMPLVADLDSKGTTNLAGMHVNRPDAVPGGVVQQHPEHVVYRGC